MYIHGLQLDWYLSTKPCHTGTSTLESTLSGPPAVTVAILVTQVDTFQSFVGMSPSEDWAKARGKGGEKKDHIQ